MTGEIWNQSYKLSGIEIGAEQIHYMENSLDSTKIANAFGKTFFIDSQSLHGEFFPIYF